MEVKTLRLQPHFYLHTKGYAQCMKNTWIKHDHCRKRNNQANICICVCVGACTCGDTVWPGLALPLTLDRDDGDLIGNPGGQVGQHSVRLRAIHCQRLSITWESKRHHCHLCLLYFTLSLISEKKKKTITPPPFLYIYRWTMVQSITKKLWMNNFFIGTWP